MSRPSVVGRRADVYDPTSCDLCETAEAETILEHPERSMTSDTRIVPAGLLKVRCATCGLVRDGYEHDPSFFDEHYGDAYILGDQALVQEPIFFTPDGPRPRSQVIHDWIMTGLDEAGAGDLAPSRVAEIGCAEGSLLGRSTAAWPDADVVGLDLHKGSVAAARARGLKAYEGGYSDLEGQFDLIYSFAVMEHVPSPTDFLAVLAGHLAEGGLLVVAQPCLDRPSSDLYFSDHLHHFRAAHVTALAAKVGLKERHRIIGHPHIGPFSLHVLQGASPDDAIAPGPPRAAAEHDESAVWARVLGRVRAHLAGTNAPLAVWGLGQTFTLFCSYAGLDAEAVVVGLDDNPDRFRAADMPFPVVRPEGLDPKEHAGLHVLFTFSPSRTVRDRLAALGVSAFDPFREDPS